MGASTEFDVEWTGSMNLYINFRTDSLRSYSMCNGYCLRLTQSYVYLYRYNFNNGAGRGGRLGSNVPITNLRDNARVAIKVDETKKIIALLINDVLVQKWENVGDLPDGKGLLFTSRTTYRMKLSRIRVTEWNGTLPEADPKPKATPKADYISLGNSDHLTGTVTRIADGKLHFNSELGEMKIDLQRVTSIHRATESYQPIPLMKESARANFKGGGGMSFKITGWKNNQVTATSPIFGEAVFDPIIFQSIDFTGNTTAQTSTRSTSSSNNAVRIEPGFAIPQQLKRQALPAPRRIPNAQFELKAIPRRPVAPQKAPRR